MPGLGKSIETESGLTASRDLGRGGQEATANGHGASPSGCRKRPDTGRWLLMAAQLCEDAKNYSIIHFDGVNFMICEL